MHRLLSLLCLLTIPLLAEKTKLSQDERIALIRGLMSESGKAKVTIPRSKKPLVVDEKGKWDADVWADAEKEFGPAARAGELIQVTKVEIKDDRIELELNHGLKTGRKWYERVEVGMGTRTAPVSRTGAQATAGSNLAIAFEKKLTALDVADVKRILLPVLDFDKHTVTESYMESLPEPIQKAIKDKRVLEGMDREQVIMAVGRPVRKERRTVDGADLEDWMYGRPPGRMTFVTFDGSKVSQVKESYAGLGGSTAAELPVQ